jgi:PadR family transcriptional regulator PadR
MADVLPLLKGTLDLLILKALSVEARHGYGLSVWLERESGGNISVEDSAIYQALRRLEGRRLIEAEWGLTENNRRARYYRLTSAGRDHLHDEVATWLRYTRWVTTLLGAGGGMPVWGER